MVDATADRESTGIDGLDTVLHGGLIPNRSYLVTGQSGTGKTILGLHFLREGARRDEPALFINLEESVDEIRENAAALDISVDGIEFLDLSPEADIFTEGKQYDVFAAGEVEGPAITDAITERISEVEPTRVFVDPLTHLRDLAPDDYQFRKQANGYMRFVKDFGATVVFTSQATEGSPDDDLQFLADGTIELHRGTVGRSLAVPKLRGSDSEAGRHAVRITDTGMRVFPVMRPERGSQDFDLETISSGVPGIDHLLHGGIERGTVTILSGPTGVGKTTLGAQFMKEAAGRGERSVIYMFEEATQTFLTRTASVNIPTGEMLNRGTLRVQEVEPLEKSPAEFASMVRHEVENAGARIVMIDGIDGYRLSLQGEEDRLERELNSLGRYLKNKGVAVILVDSVEGVIGDFQPTNRGVSYLADNIVFLSYLELSGKLAKAIGVLKKRTSDFERTLRKFEITPHGIVVGEPLGGLRGILSGTPEFIPEPDQPTRADTQGNLPDG